MTAINEVQQSNRQLARRINEEARRDPQSVYAGKFVGIANGQVVAVADDLDELVCRLRQVEPDPQRTFCIEAELDYDTPQDDPFYSLAEHATADAPPLTNEEIDQAVYAM